MSNPYLAELFKQYPTVIDQMSKEFTSHEFILKLAQQYQEFYIKALNEYCNLPAPFQVLHSKLAIKLNDCSSQVIKVCDAAPSKDIFGRENTCAKWRKA